MSDSENSWQRLSPVAVVFYLIRIINQVISNALQGLAPLIVLLFSAKNKLLIISASLLGLICFIVIAAILQYWFFRYRVRDNEVQISQGVFKKKFRAIQFDRVQNINIKQPIYFKPFALVSLFIETAGSAGDEGVLAGINETEAQTLTDILLKKRQAATTPAEQQADQPLNDDDKAPTLLAKASMSDLIKHGLSNNKFLILIAFLAPFYNSWKNQVNDWAHQVNLQSWFDLFPSKPIAVLITFVIASMAIFVLFALISIVGSILSYHQYRLTLSKQTLVRKSGLLNTHQESLNLSKLQAIQRRCNWIARVLGIESLVLAQADGHVGNRQHQHNKSSSLFIVPSRTPSQSIELIAAITGEQPTMQPTNAISKRFIVKNWLVYFMLPVAVFAGFELSHAQTPSPWLLLLALCALPLVYLRWKNYGFRLDGEYGLIKSGFIGYRYERFALHKAQNIVLAQSWWQKRSGVANLHISLASGSIVIPYMPQAQALAWFNQLCYHIERDNRAWF